MVEKPRVKLRGAPQELWDHIQAAIHEGVEPPMEWVAAGVTGSGKSYGNLGALLMLASDYPDVPGRVLLARLTRRSLTTSTCATIRKVMPRGHSMFRGARDDNRASYKLGEWEFVLAGIDNIDNLLSSEWDFVYCDELRQFPLSAWEDIQIRALRNHALYRYDRFGNRAEPGQGVSKIPFGMAIGSTNPGKRKHWIRDRAGTPQQPGKLRLVDSWVQDNPAYFKWNAEQLELEATAEGEVFVRRCELYTGVRYRRMVRNEWCSAEGAVFEDWQDDMDVPEANRNVVRIKRDANGWISSDTCRALDIREFYAGVDFGDDSPGCIVVAGYTGAKKLIVVAEAYARKKKLDWWAKRVAEINAHYPIKLGWCDHGWNTFVDAFNDAVGAEREGPGQVFVNADKNDKPRSTALMAMRIERRTLVYDVDALIHPPDETLVEASLPTCTVDEIPDYVHDRKSDEDDITQGEKNPDRPDPDNHDHGVDASLYLVRGVDYLAPGVQMVSPEERRYLERLKRMQEPYGGHPMFKGGEWRDPDDAPDGDGLTDDEWLVEQIRSGLQ
jgi:hypothetical protein